MSAQGRELLLKTAVCLNCSSVLAGSGASILQKAEIRVINQTICNQLLSGQLTPRMMCVGILTGGVDACQVGKRCDSTGSVLLAGVAASQAPCSALFLLARGLAFPYLTHCTAMWLLGSDNRQIGMLVSSKLT